VFRRWPRFSRLIAAAALGAGILVPVSFLTAGAASAAGYDCVDIAISNPTPVHSDHTDASVTLEFLAPGTEVSTSNCGYVDNTSENRWYMQVQVPGNITGWIWVHRLYFGQSHLCDTSVAGLQQIGSSWCPLFYFS
jgi:hypothetical protein